MSILFVFFFVIGNVLGAPCNCHTWHNVTASRGTWSVTVTATHEDATFVKPEDWRHLNCTNYKQPRGHFNISKEKWGSFGYKFAAGDDFNSMYTMTVLRTDKHGQVGMPYKQMGCVFVIGAAGPAMPDVRAENYNGAICMWSRVPGVGENYDMDFAPRLN